MMKKKRLDDTKEIASSLNNLLGKSILKRRQFITFLIQLAIIDNGISSDEERILKIISNELNISSEIYDSIVNSLQQKMKSNQQTMTPDKAYEILGVNKVYVRKIQ